MNLVISHVRQVDIVSLLYSLENKILDYLQRCVLWPHHDPKLGLVVSIGRIVGIKVFVPEYGRYIESHGYIDEDLRFSVREYAAAGSCKLLTVSAPKPAEGVEQTWWATFSGDMHLNAYNIASEWPGYDIRDVPIPLDTKGIQVVTNYPRRLVPLGAVTHDELKFEASSSGRLAGELFKVCGCYDDHFGAACRIAMLKTSGLSVTLQRVVIRLLLLSLRDWLLFPDAGLRADHIRDVCTGVGKALARRGNY